jgi:hypothetical protein
VGPTEGKAVSEAGPERRQWPRIPAALLSNVTASIMAGPEVKLVNLSRGGALMEVAARYPMRSKVRVKLTRSTGEVTQVAGTVSWARVASIANGKINYLLAVIFESPIEDLALATGVQNIEAEALASMTPDPDFGDDAIHEVQTDSPAAPAQSPAPLASATPGALFVEADLSNLLSTPRDSVSAVPVSAGTSGQQAGAPPQDLIDRAQLIVADSRAEDLRRELERAAADAAALAATNDSLSTQLQALGVERTTLRSELEVARRRWDDEKRALTAEAAGALSRLTELDDALQQHQQSGGQALAEQEALAQTLSVRLAALEAERASLRGDLSSDRQQWDDERLALERAAADAAARLTELQGRIERRELEHTQALADARRLQVSLRSQLDVLEAERVEWGGQQQAERQAFQADRESWQIERQASQVERETLAREAAEAIGRVRALEAALQLKQDEYVNALAEQQAATLSLAAQIEAIDAERLQARRQLEDERSRWDEERVRSSAEFTDRISLFQAALETREQIHADAMAEQQARFEGLIAELVQAANDQQAEYQQLMTERTAAFEEQMTRLERALAEAAGVGAESEQQRHALELRCRELAVELEAAEAVTVAQENRYRAVRQEAERLVALLSSPVQAQLPVADINGFRADGDAAQAVAGG